MDNVSQIGYSEFRHKGRSLEKFLHGFHHLTYRAQAAIGHIAPITVRKLHDRKQAPKRSWSSRSSARSTSGPGTARMGKSLPPQSRRVGLGSGERAAESSAAASVPHRSRIARELCDETCGCRVLRSGFIRTPSVECSKTPHTNIAQFDRDPGPFIGLIGLCSCVIVDTKL